MPDKLSLDALLNAAAGGSNIPENTDTTSETNDDKDSTDATSGVDSETKNEDPNTDDESDEGDDEDNNPNPPKQETPTSHKKDGNNPMKELRNKYNEESKARNKITTIMQRYTDGDYNLKLKDFKGEDGKLDYDKLQEAMDDIDTSNKAKTNNITPEVQRELDRIQREKQEIAKERLRVGMDKALAGMQISLGLSDSDINQFFKDALAQNRNPYAWLASGFSINDLYYIIYRDKLTTDRVTKAVAEERAKWENPVKAPSSNPAPTKPTSKIKEDGLSLSEILAQAATKK